MPQHLTQIALLVKDYDEAIQFYTLKMNFTVVENTRLSETKRWVLLAPAGSEGCRILLARAIDDEQKTRIGNQTGGRVFLFLHTDDFIRDYQNLKEKGIAIVREAAMEPYGMVAVFADLYGNLWDLIGPSPNKFQHF